MSDKLNCSFCIFYEGPRDQQVLGLCRRFPPTSAGILPQAGMDGKVKAVPAFAFPQVRSKHDWCGEFKDIPQEEGTMQ